MAADRPGPLKSIAAGRTGPLTEREKERGRSEGRREAVGKG